MIFLDVYIQSGKDFDETTRHILKDNPEARDFILDHPRKQLVLNQMCREISLLEQNKHLKGRNPTEMQLQRAAVVRGVTEIFIRTALAAKERELQSEAAKAPTNAERAMAEIERNVIEIDSSRSL